MADPEIPEVAVQAAAEVLFEHRKVTDPGDPLTLEYFTERAREVLAAALPHLLKAAAAAATRPPVNATVAAVMAGAGQAAAAAVSAAGEGGHG